MAAEGEITAATVVLKFGANDHRAGIFGTYKHNQSEALHAVLILKAKLVLEVLPMFRKTY